MIVFVAVIVLVPLIVAALVNGNGTVGVIDAVDAQESVNFVNMATNRPKPSAKFCWPDCVARRSWSAKSAYA